MIVYKRQSIDQEFGERHHRAVVTEMFENFTEETKASSN